MSYAAGQLADRLHLLRLPQLVLRAPPFGYVRVKRYESAAGQAISAIFHGHAARTPPFRRPSAYTGSQPLQASPDFLFDVNLSEFSGDGLCAQDVLLIQPNPKNVRRDASEFGHVFVPFHETQVRVDN
ncbi:MAG TPA: hypothetical protein VNW90_04240 [Acetobacteraceae bacterium]|nr:hypothetical protein [Acetobacteraceae bacterium]